MTRKRRVKSKKTENKSSEKIVIDDKQMRSLVSFGLFPLAYAVGFIPEMAYIKQMLLFVVVMIAGNIGIMRILDGKSLILGVAGLFILGSVLNVLFIGTSQIVILLVLGIVFAIKLKKVLGKDS